MVNEAATATAPIFTADALVREALAEAEVIVAQCGGAGLHVGDGFKAILRAFPGIVARCAGSNRPRSAVAICGLIGATSSLAVSEAVVELARAVAEEGRPEVLEPARILAGAMISQWREVGL